MSAARKPMSASVKNAVETKTGTPLGGRAARVIGCRRCGGGVFTGLDGDLMAFEATADVRPLNAADELTALLQGRRTYELRWEVRGNRGRYELDRRTAGRIAARPPGTRGLDVLAEHRCGDPLGHAVITIRPSGAGDDLPADPPY